MPLRRQKKKITAVHLSRWGLRQVSPTARLSHVFRRVCVQPFGFGKRTHKQTACLVFFGNFFFKVKQRSGGGYRHPRSLPPRVGPANKPAVLRRKFCRSFNILLTMCRLPRRLAVFKKLSKDCQFY